MGMANLGAFGCMLYKVRAMTLRSMPWSFSQSRVKTSSEELVHGAAVMMHAHR